MRVTLDVFSGRPNPSWHLSERQARELGGRLRAQEAAPAAVAPATSLPLGFRGLIVSEDVPGELTPKVVPWPHRVTAFAAPAQLRAESQRAVLDDELDTADWLLTTAPRAVPDELEEAVRSELTGMRRASDGGGAAARADDEADRAFSAPTDADEALATAVGRDGCRPFVTPTRFPFWNTPAVQPFNNCYNYAANFVSGTRAQPGRRSGRMYASFRGEDVLAAAARDGVELACSDNVRVVALGIWPGLDFHWWRMHPNGSWGHKIGWWPAQDRDNSFRVIADGLTLATCDRGLYSDFVGYFFVPLSTWVV